MIVNELTFKDLELIVYLNQSNIFFTIFSIYFFFNLINFSDGANGITISLCIYWLIIFAIFGSLNLLFIYSLIIILILILIFNLKNKIFLGDSGSLFLGGIVSVYVVYILSNNYVIKSEFDLHKILFVISIF